MSKKTPAPSPRPTFPAEKFTTLDSGHGADKLAACAVAPLVAAARGYETIRPDGIKDAVARLRLGSMNSGHARQLKNDVGLSDAMLMPWYRVDETAAAANAGNVATHTTLQMRPAEPIIGKDGKQRKYDMFKGTDTELDLHPATPASWATDPAGFFFTEGLIKGDAALTGLLRAAGISAKQLAKVHDGGDPAMELRALMEQVPPEHRFLIISFVGVGNWKGRHEWNSLPVKGRPVWVAFDADAAVNRNVWDQARQLLTHLDARHASSAQLVNLALASPEAAATKAGVDDFLAEYGRWEDLAGALTDLPERPAGKDEGAPKEWRVHPGGVKTQEAVPVQDDGLGESTRWVDRVPIGGRVLSEETLRQPTRTEMLTGRTAPYDESADVRVEVETSWMNEQTDLVDSAVVTGPAIVLGYPPKDWDRKGGRIPASLLRHPEWPPEEGLKWLRAVKKNRTAETTTNTRWACMGWVPSDEGLPSYIVGNQVMTADGIQTSSPIIGVGDDMLAGASNFGVVPPAADVDWMEQARADLRDVMDVYIDSGAWTDPKMASTILAIALRPAIPVRPSTVAYFVGARRSGKSFSASHVMSFWHPSPGTWGGDHLPGSAKDTIASMEHSVAHANIWVSDDLAPSTDRNQASREEAAMGDLIRSIHNGTGKRRMNADMTARAVNNPRAVLIVTAENEPSVSSVSDRLVLLHFGDGVLGDRSQTNRLEEMLGHGGQPARLAGAFIRWHLWKAAQSPDGWAGMVTRVEDEIKECEAYAAQVISRSDKGDASRHAGMAADVMISLVRLSQMADDLGMGREFTRRLAMAGLPALVAQQVASAHDEQKGTSPGRRVLQAVGKLLSAGQAHVAALDDPNYPPASGDNESDLINRQLGWVKQGGESRPLGPRIGWAVTTPDRHTPVILLDQVIAFDEAQRRYPGLLPYGQKQATAWTSAWDERLTVPESSGWKRRSNGRSLQPTVRVSSGDQKVAGVPVLRELLLNGVGDEDSDEDDTE
ncbi:hypothetical protein GCG21_13585 [Pseudactinotalea sp. HY160]|uniref:hypothetical protein n=1 Tax=Pseudactinotalea sp. HY160 TaxID=2654490 RepID=UPI00128B0A95|nr:hypothetical protein [Pseudactinotalea sp. HY160]MPV51018.1 hypothetical protein [Pseudactinotalea sp. HY160]